MLDSGCLQVVWDNALRHPAEQRQRLTAPRGSRRSADLREIHRMFGIIDLHGRAGFVAVAPGGDL